MGFLADAFDRLFERKVAIGATIPSWDAGRPQFPQRLGVADSLRMAREGYSANEVVYACIEELATSAAEPRYAAYRRKGVDLEKLDTHPVLDLLDRPNPFMDRYAFTAGIITALMVSGNAYVEKVRSRATGVVELWLLRPDRVRVVPDARTFIRGYEYRIGDFVTEVPAEDVIQVKLRNPADDYYGLAPLAVCAPRVDTDNWMRAFTRSFFTNAGVPAGLLSVTRAVNAAERDVIRSKWRGELGGAGGWHGLMVLDNTQASYQAMGLPLGERGLVLPELDEIDEARLAMVFGVPLELIGARLGMIHGNRSTMQAARATFWDETLSPLYAMLTACLTLGLVDEFSGFDVLEIDTTTVKALQEDEDAKHARIRDDVKAGLLTRKEARLALGLAEEPEGTGEDFWLYPSTTVATPVGSEGAPAPPAPPAPGPGAPPGANTEPSATPAGAKALPAPVRITAADLAATKRWAQEVLSAETAARVVGPNGTGPHG